MGMRLCQWCKQIVDEKRQILVPYEGRVYHLKPCWIDFQAVYETYSVWEDRR
jgi:hypothetical protein